MSAPFNRAPRLPRCPVCESFVDPESTATMPFCSQRCQQIDLGRWLDEGYGLPLERDPEGEEPEATA